METENFGEHLMIDGYDGNYKLLNDKDNVLSFIDKVIEVSEMHKLAEPVVYKAEDNGSKDGGGWTAFCVIMESHVSVHTFPSRKFASFDVYTCKNGLKLDEIRKAFVEAFGFKKDEEHFVVRGTEYPRYNYENIQE